MRDTLADASLARYAGQFVWLELDFDKPENEAFRFRLQFKKSHVSRDELIRTLREILAQLEGTSEADSTAA